VTVWDRLSKGGELLIDLVSFRTIIFGVVISGRDKEKE